MIDLKAFKKLHSSKTHTTLLHEDGHEVRLAHDRLREADRQTLAKMPHFADGGEAAPYFLRANSQPEESSTPMALRKPEDMGQMSTPGVASIPGLPNNINSASDIPSASPGDIANAASNLPTSSSGPLQFASSGSPEDASNPDSKSMPVQNSDPNAIPNDPLSAYQKAYGMETVANQGMGRVGAEQGAAEAKAAKNQADQLGKLHADSEQQRQNINGELNNVLEDIKAGHIDPQHYMNSMGTGGKIATAIGLLAGGFAPGGQNPAMEYLNKQIERDVDAQKSDMGNKHNLFNAYLKQYGNVNDAEAMTRATYAQMYGAQLAQAAGNSKNQSAKLMAQQHQADLINKYEPQLQGVALRQAALKGMSGGQLDPAVAVPHLVPEAHQKDVYHEIKTAQDVAHNENDMLDAFDKARGENTMLKTGGGMLRTPASIMKMTALSLPMIHDAEGRVNEYEANTLKDLQPHPGDSEDKIDQKRQALISFMQQKKSAPTAKAYGIDLAHNATSNSSKAKFTPSR